MTIHHFTGGYVPDYFLALSICQETTNYYKLLLRAKE